MIFPLIIFLSTIHVSWGIIGYDCGAQSLNITTVSLLDVGQCDIPDTPVNITKRYVQLLQLNEYSNTHVVQCKIIIHRTVYWCGKGSHVSIVSNGQNEFVHEISRKSCLEAYNTGTFYLDGKHTFTGLKINQTTTRPVLFAGSLATDGTCNGAGYSDSYGSWDYALVQGYVKITIQEQYSTVSMNNDQVIFRSGTHCTFSENECIDIEGGYSFWDFIPTDTCKFRRYGILFEGLVNKIIDNTMNNEEVVYSLTTKDITFALVAKNKENLCGYTVIRTEHPKLFIFETVKDISFADRSKTSTDNLDIFAYVNSKFVFVEKFIKTQVKFLYRDMLIQRCKQERLTLKNSLAIATQAPDQFAYDMMKGPGYMAVAAGEVVHVIKCIPVEVQLSHGEECYSELKVSLNNQTMFLTPRTHILKNRGTLVTCNSVLATHYFIHNRWMKFVPNWSNADEPMTLEPHNKVTWEYQNIPSLAVSGIYTEKDLESLRERIMFPIEQTAVINEVTREMHGHTITDTEGTIGRLLNENAVEKIVENAWNRMWTKFLTFGTVSAGVFSVIIIIQAIKTFINFLINGYALHQMYGWSVHLFAALWGSLATFLLYIGRPATTDSPTDNSPTDIEQNQRETQTFLQPPPYPPSENIQTTTYHAEVEKSPRVQLQPQRSTGFFSYH